MYLSLLIPAFNEALRIKPGLEKAIDFLKEQNFSWEIIVVDDGSSDKTRLIVSRFCRENEGVRLISLGNNFGKGHAIRVGITAASGKFIIFSDADFSVSIKTLPLCLEKLKSFGLVLGSRRQGGSKIIKHQQAIRESLGHVFTQLGNLFLDLKVTDSTCGFKGFRKEVAKQIFEKQRLNRWVFDSEVLFLASKYKIRTSELPVVWKNDERTKVSLLKDVLISFVELIKIRIYDFCGCY